MSQSRSRSFQFSLGTLLVATLFISLVLGWWVQYSNLAKALASERYRRLQIGNAANEMLYKELNATNVKGQLVSVYPIERLANGTFDKTQWEKAFGNGFIYLLNSDDQDHQEKIACQGRFKGYYFVMEDDGEGSSWTYYVLTCDDTILAVARTMGSLD